MVAAFYGLLAMAMVMSALGALIIRGTFGAGGELVGFYYLVMAATLGFCSAASGLQLFFEWAFA